MFTLLPIISDALPTKFTNCTSSLSEVEVNQEAPETKRMRLEYKYLEQATEESLASEKQKQLADRVTSFPEFNEKLKGLKLNRWITSKHVDKTLFYFEEDEGVIRLCVSVCANLNINIHYNGDRVPLKEEVVINSLSQFETYLKDVLGVWIKGPLHENLEENLASVKNIISTIEDLLEHLLEKLPDSTNLIEFLKEQLSLLGVSNMSNGKYAFKYSTTTVLFCGLLHTISPHAYRFLRSSNLLILPTPKTIKQLCGSLTTNPRLEQNQILQYVSSKLKLLKKEDKTVTIMFDEIHLNPFIDYKGGNIVGTAFNNSEAATSAFAFMVNSLLSPYKEVVHILPVKTITAEQLHEVLKQLINELEDMGFEVLAIVSDANRINKKAMTFFCHPPKLLNTYPHPKEPSRPLFYVLDTVQIIKNIKNNWLNQKPDQTLQYPAISQLNSSDNLQGLIKTASFEALKEMHSKEHSLLVKYGHTLSLNSLYPSSIECQNVKLTLQIFNYHIVAALRDLGPKINLQNYSDTADFIEHICKWWDIVNVKSPLKGLRNRNQYQEPVTINSKHIFDFLEFFLKWLKTWDTSNTFQKLTRDTHLALFHSTEALLNLSKYCLEKKNYTFVLLGKIQTDKLEERFGNYRYKN